MKAQSTKVTGLKESFREDSDGLTVALYRGKVGKTTFKAERKMTACHTMTFSVDPRKQFLTWGQYKAILTACINA